MSDLDLPITAMTPKRHRSAVKQLVNEERRRHGLAALRFSAQLSVSARAWAVVQRANDGDLSHGNFARRALRFPFVLAGRPALRRTVGENLGFGTGDFSTPREIVAEWMRSPGHRANILRPWVYGAVWSSPTGVDGVTVVHHMGRSNRA